MLGLLDMGQSALGTFHQLGRNSHMEDKDTYVIGNSDGAYSMFLGTDQLWKMKRGQQSVKIPQTECKPWT